MVVSGATAKQRPVGGQAEPGHTQQSARAPADPSAPRGEHRVFGGCFRTQDQGAELTLDVITYSSLISAYDTGEQRQRAEQAFNPCAE